MVPHGFLLSGGVIHHARPARLDPDVAFGINNVGGGQIVGDYKDVGGTFHGFLLSGGQYTTLDPPGRPSLSARGSTTPARSWGATTMLVAMPPFHGFLLSGGVYTTLDVPGATSTQIFSINNAGQIVGSYDDAKGNTHGFLATPVPEPATSLLVGQGTLGWIGYAWRKRRRGRLASANILM